MSDAVEIGTCSECKQELLRTADDCWHPWRVPKTCPPTTMESGMQRVVWGEGFGRPGRDKFVPASSVTPGDREASGHDSHLAVDGDWIVAVLGRHTCGAGPGSGAGCEPGCGSEPVMKVADLEALGFVRRMERDALVDVFAAHICRLLDHREGGDECEADYEAGGALADELIARQFPAETTLLPRCVNTGSLITSPRCPTCNGNGVTGSLAGVSECGQCGGCGHICDEMARQPYSAALAAVRSLPTSRTAAWGRGGWDSVSLAAVLEILKAGDDE